MADRHDGPGFAGAARVRAPEQDTLGASLERARLTHREHRVEQVLAQLGERRSARSGSVPKALDQAIDGFSVELTQVGAQLSAFKRVHEAKPRADATRTPVSGTVPS